jgi:hypothetical protein
MRAMQVVLLGLMTSGCWAYERETRELPALVERPAVYSRAEIDAINAEIACRYNARTGLQMERCYVRRMR